MNSCVLRLLIVWMLNKAESICKKVGEKLRRTALHAFMIYCGTKSVRIAPPNTLTDSYTQFLPETQLCLNFTTRTSKSKPYKITLPTYTILIHCWVVYATLIICWNTPCFNTLWSYTQHFYTAELYPILAQCWDIPYLVTLLSNSQFQYIADLYPILKHC